MMRNMQANPAQVPGVASQSKPRLLVADDSPLQRHALCEFLRGSGYEVAEASDGHAVLRHLKECEIDLLLLDLNMPHGDGFEVLSYLQEHRQSLPVILLSGMPLDQIQHKMHRLRKQELPALLLKPVDPQQLLQMVELLLSGEISGTELTTDRTG
jgi:two-component system sensor histidine kinase ChiS